MFPALSRTLFRNVLILSVLLALTGCQSFGRGVTRALIDESRAAPEGEAALCEITGPSFSGLAAGLAGGTPDSPKTSRLLIVHGIGEHLPGYSERLQRSLAARLGLDAIDPVTKVMRIAPDGPALSDAERGYEPATLRMNRFTDDRGRDLLIFEVTWSSITAPERRNMMFDSSGAAAKTRAALNASLKNFMNARAADPLAYRGTKGDPIRDAVVQSICWATSGPWDSYRSDIAARCDWSAASREVVAHDAFAISSHSLGSQIVMDALESLGDLNAGVPPGGNAALAEFRDKRITFFMLSNQLPLLQIGHTPAAVTNAGAVFCGPGAPAANQHWIDKVSIVAFSDPNDLLSYSIPPDFATSNIDSRMCAETTNVTIKVAKELDLAVTTFASPEAAHLQYEDDNRVLDMMVGGLGTTPPPACSWLRYAEPVRNRPTS